MDAKLKTAAEYWDKPHQTPRRSRWWQHPGVLRHINELVCGKAIDGPFAGFHQKIAINKPNGAGFKRGISIGCGVATKEISLLVANIVQHFDLYEISPARLEQAQKNARNSGVFERISFHNTDAFLSDDQEKYGLVYWNNSLHHMLDTEETIRWTHDKLDRGGLFAMDDFVGASRFQWTDYELQIASQVRQILPERLLVHPSDTTKRLPKTLLRPLLERMIEIDPTEAADSSNILKSIRKYFPDAAVLLTGGVIYHLALNDVLANFDDAIDNTLLKSLLLLDATLARNGVTQYATAIAHKK